MHEIHPTDGALFSDIKERVLALRNEGVVCPACDQVAHDHRRGLNESNAKCLIALELLCQGNTKYFHIAEIFALAEIESSVGREFAIARHWGLIEQRPKDNSEYNKKTSGCWRITPFGRMFVNGQVKIQKAVLTYNTKCIGFVGPDVSIGQLYGEGFRYPEAIAPALSPNEVVTPADIYGGAAED